MVMTKFKKVIDRNNIKKINGVIIVGLFAVLGVVLLIPSHAQSPSASAEAENGTLSGTALLQADATTSSGAYVDFSSIPVADQGLISQYRNLAIDTQAALATQSSSTDTQYYSNGVWLNPGAASPQSYIGPGTLSAYLWHYGGHNQTYYNEAVETMNTAIATQQAADGSFDGDLTTSTQFVGNQLADTYLQLESGLDPATKTAWENSINLAMSYLEAHEYNFYSNGNINLGQTLFAYKAWLVTGNPAYETVYNNSLAFTLEPGTGWPGYGLQYTTQPTNASCSNGAGYLAEQSGTTPPGYDGDYTMLQLTLAAELYVLSRSSESLCLTNLFANQLLLHIDTNTWILDALDGSRHSLEEPAWSSGFAVLALLGGRTDLLPDLQGQFTDGVYPPFYDNATQNFGSPGLYRDYGTDVSLLYKLTYL